MPKIRPAIVVAAAFATAAVAAVGVGMVALNSIGTGLGDGPVQPVAGAGANPGNTVGTSVGSNPAVSPSINPTASPRTSGLAVPDGPARTFDTPGGVIVARCIGRQAYLVSWSPNPGFRTDDVDRGPAAQAEVEFSSDTGEVEATIVCASGTATIVIEENEHGGGGRN